MPSGFRHQRRLVAHCIPVLCADYIVDSNPLCNRFIPTTKSLTGIMAGMTEGMIEALGFPVTVSAARSKTVGEAVIVVKMPE